VPTRFWLCGQPLGERRKQIARFAESQASVRVYLGLVTPAPSLAFSRKPIAHARAVIWAYAISHFPLSSRQVALP
jgi:hypothetical protein